MYFGDGFALYDELAVGPEEECGVELLLQLFEGEVYEELLLLEGACVDEFVGGVAPCDLIGLQGQEFFAEVDEERVFVDRAFLVEFAYDLVEVVCGCAGGGVLGELFVFVECSGDFFGVVGLEDVVDAICFKCFEGVVVVGGDEDDRLGDADLFEDVEGVAIGEVDVHEEEVAGGAVGFEPGDGFGDSGQFFEYDNGGVYVAQQVFEVAGIGWFVFNYENVECHITGELDE